MDVLRSARRKKAIAFAVVGALVVLAGVVMLGLLLEHGFDLDNRHDSRRGVGSQLIVAGGAVVIGIGCLIAAVRSLSGKSG